MEGCRLVPGLLAASLQIFVDGILAAHEVRHFRPHLFNGDFFPLIFVFELGNLEPSGHEFPLGGFGLLDLEQQGFFLRVLARIDQDLTDFGRQFFENALADHQRLEMVGVVHLGQVALVGFVELHGPEADVAVTLAVDVAGLEGVEGHGPRDEGRDSPERLVGGDHDRTLRHAEFQPLHIAQFGNRVLVVGDEAESRVRPRQDTEPGFGGVLVQQFRRGAVGPGHDLVQVGEQVGQGQKAQLLFKGHDVGDAAKGHVERALLDLAETFPFVVARRAAVNADNLDGAVGLVFHIFFERIAHDAHFGAFGIAHGDRQRRVRRGGGRGGSGGGAQEEPRHQQGNDGFAAHSILFFLIGLCEAKAAGGPRRPAVIAARYP